MAKVITVKRGTGRPRNVEPKIAVKMSLPQAIYAKVCEEAQKRGIAPTTAATQIFTDNLMAIN